MTRPNLDYALAQLHAAGADGYLSDGSGSLSQRKFKQAVYQLRANHGYVITRVHETKFSCRYFLNAQMSNELVGPPIPPIPHRLLAWIEKNPGLLRSDMICIAPETSTRTPLNELIAQGKVFSCKKYRGGNVALYFASESARQDYMLTQPERPDTKARKRELQRLSYAKMRGAAYKQAKPKMERKRVQGKFVPGKAITIQAPKRTKSLPAFVGEVDASRAVYVLCEGYSSRDLSEGAERYFRSLAIGSYIPNDSAISRAYTK